MPGDISIIQGADLYVVTRGERATLSLLHCIVDLRTDLPIRIRRRAGHRKRRRGRARYRRQGRPFKLRRPSMLRSAWRQQLRYRRSNTPSGMIHLSHTMCWRAQAITRVIKALQLLLPISHAVILSPPELYEPYRVSDAARLRQQLIDTYGYVALDGARYAMCAYCQTTEGRIEVDHIIPSSRGGTDGWQNRVLACATCNARKGNRMPEEAGMPLRIMLTSTPAAPNRAGSYARSTARLLIETLAALGIATRPRDQADDPYDEWPVELYDALLKANEVNKPVPVTIAKPIARPTKQVFTGRNYPLTTPMRPGLVRVGQTLRRRVQVNRALLIENNKGRRIIRIVPANEPLPEDSSRIIEIGMLCEGLRREQKVVGIVVAIHSAGRLTLLVPEAADSTGVSWRRIVVSPRQQLRVLSTDKVIFLPVP